MVLAAAAFRVVAGCVFQRREQGHSLGGCPKSAVGYRREGVGGHWHAIQFNVFFYQ